MLEEHSCWSNLLLLCSEIVTREIAIARTSTKSESSSSVFFVRLKDVKTNLESSPRERPLVTDLFISDPTPDMGVTSDDVSLTWVLIFCLKVNVLNVGSV